MPGDGVTHRLGDDQADARSPHGHGRCGRSSGAGPLKLPLIHVHHRSATSLFPAPADRLPEQGGGPEAVFFRKHCGGVTSVPRGDYAVRDLRPLLRRAETMARPARVRIRVRKPCLWARRRLFGWKVRLPLATVLTPCSVVRARRASAGDRPRVGEDAAFRSPTAVHAVIVGVADGDGGPVQCRPSAPVVPGGGSIGNVGQGPSFSDTQRRWPIYRHDLAVQNLTRITTL